MEKIVKQNVDPKPLADFKSSRIINGVPQKTSYEDDFRKYDNDDYKNDYKKELLKEQFYLCAYCNRSLSNDDNTLHKLKIEHWYPQHFCKQEADYGTTNGRDLSHYNMLIVCPGENANPAYRHCDSSRTPEKKLTIEPQHPTYIFEQTFSYSGVELITQPPNQNIKDDINDELNLNHFDLKKERRIILDQFIKEQKKHKIDKAILVAKYSNPNKEGKKKQYCTLILHYVNNYLN